MVWDSITSGVGKAAAFNHWPQPFNFLRRAEVLMCNDDYWLAEFEFAFDVFAHFFWTNLIPSPREIERKTLTGSYRCGFYSNVKVKSPIQIVFGNGTSRMIGEIAAPFARAFFYWWAAETAIEAFHAWQTILHRQLLCAPFIGDVLRANDRGIITGIPSVGIPALGDQLYDPQGFNEPGGPLIHAPPGGNHLWAAYLFNANPSGLAYTRTGWQRNGEIIELESHGSVAPSAQKAVIRHFYNLDPDFSELAPYVESETNGGVVPGAVILVRFGYDHVDDPPARWGLPLVTPYDWPENNPKCAQDVF